MELNIVMKNRRSRYDLTGASPISDQRIQEIVEDAVTYTPSAFHSQSSRVMLLLGEDHQKLWKIVMDTLRTIVPEDKFAPTEKKIQSFAAGHGTVLYFEDMETVKDMQVKNSAYADNFPIWSHQSAGMLQYALWISFTKEGLGASLQHYNPLIDEAVAKEFSVPKGWKLVAQMPFGATFDQPSLIKYKPIEERFVVKNGKPL